MESSKVGADSILMSGYLSKRPRNLRRGSVGSGGMTKKRFLVLSEGSLEWRESDKSTVAKNSMPITAATTVELTLDRPSKTLVVNGELTLIGPAEELRAWAEAIQAHVASLSGTAPPPASAPETAMADSAAPPQPLVGKPSADYMARQPKPPPSDVNYGPDGGEVSQRVVEVTASGAAVASESAAITGEGKFYERVDAEVASSKALREDPQYGGEPPKLVRAFLERSLATIEHALASSEAGGGDDNDELAEASKKKKAPKLLQWRPDVDKAAIDEVNDEIKAAWLEAAAEAAEGGGGVADGLKALLSSARKSTEFVAHNAKYDDAIVAVVRSPHAPTKEYIALGEQRMYW